MVAVGWSHLCAALLIISGGSKLVDPEPTRGALRASGLPAGRPVVAVLAIWEIAAGGLALGFGGTAGGLALAATYSGFALFVVNALTRGIPIRSCGCFGRDDTPPTWAHVGVNLAAAVSGGVLAVTGNGGLSSTLSGQPLAGLPYLAFLAVGVYTLYLLLAELPRTLALGRAT